jgi:cytochrome P450
LVAQLVEYWKAAPAGFEIDVTAQMSALTLDVVGIVLFSHEFHGLGAVEAWVTTNSNHPASSDPKKKNDFQDPLTQGLNLLSVLLYCLWPPLF